MGKLSLGVVTLALGFMTAFSARAVTSCPNVTLPGGATRGSIHTEVYDEHLGQMRAIYSGRQYTKPGAMYFVYGTSSSCPPQGCSEDPTETLDCTISATAQPYFFWNLTHNGYVQLTTAEGLWVKRPAGAVSLDQTAVGSYVQQTGGTCPILTISPGVSGIRTEVVDKDSGLGLKVLAIRIYEKPHDTSPGAPIDFYMNIQVDSSNTFTADSSGQTGDCTQLGSAPNGWYDLYWAAAANSAHADTVYETSNINAGVLTLDQAY